MREGIDRDAAYEAAGLAALRSVEGFTPAELVDHVYGGPLDLSDRIELARKSSPVLEAALREIEDERRARTETSVKDRDRQLDEIVLASLRGPDALRALLSPDREPWFREAVEKALARSETPGKPVLFVVEGGAPIPRPSRFTRFVRPALALAACLGLGLVLWSLVHSRDASNLAHEGVVPPAVKPVFPSSNRGKLAERPPKKPLVKPPRTNRVVRKDPSPSKVRGTKVAVIPKPRPLYPRDVAKQIALYATLPAAITTRGIGNARPRAIELARPDPGDATLDGLSPRFAWETAPGASSSVEARLERVAIDGTVLQTVPLKPAPDSHGGVPEAPLVPGALYRLSLMPPLDPGSTDLPEETRYVFRAPSAGERASIAWADRHARRLPKESAIVYYLAGRYAAAGRAAAAAPPKAFADAKSRAWRARFVETLKARRADPSRTELP